MAKPGSVEGQSQSRKQKREENTKSSSKLFRDQTSNPTSSTNPTPKGRIRRSSKQKVENSNFEEHLPFVATMADNRTMAEMLRALTEGCAEAIVVLLILAEQFELKHSLINMMTSEQFFKLEKDNPHDHIRWGSPPTKIPLNAAAGGNLLEKSPQDALTIIENKSKVRNSRSKPIASPLRLRPLRKFVLPAEVLIPTTSVLLPVATISQNLGIISKVTFQQPQATTIRTSLSNQTNEIKNMMASLLQMNTASTLGSGSLPSNTVANPKGELKAITTRSGLVTDGPTVPTPPKSITLEVGERVHKTYTDPDLAEYIIKVSPPPVQKHKPPSQRNFVVHTRDSPLSNIPYPSRMLKQKQQEKDEGKDSGLKDSIDQTDLANLDDYFVDPTPEMFIDEHAPDYSSPSRFDVDDDDFLEVESDADNFYDDPFDSKGEKIKESKLLIDELDLPCDFLPYSEYDSFNSQDFSKDYDLPLTNNEDKVFNPGLLIQEKLVTIITRVAKEKKLAISYTSLVFEDFDTPFYETLVFKDVPKSMMLLLFSSVNEEKVFKPGIYTSEKVYSYFLPELSHPGYHVFKVNQIFISLMKIFHFQCGKNTPLLDVLLFHFYPP
uniref:Reverse transcriptase domain-containing protein n=1 Tax=Tanacetum cinerariifolium TaxID=118510 RepID=A0A6L2NAR4_TANCI|nr:hypothetical protein [Tanacetum cinerariifolium]